MKAVSFLFLILLGTVCHAQKQAPPSEKFTIEGEVKRLLTFSIADLDSFPVKSLPDIAITDHNGTVKHTITRLKGVSLKDILARAEINAENPKVLSEFYFEFVATDHYKVVFSWNELFNTQTGNNAYIVMGEDGKDIKDLPGRVSMIVMTDLTTGRRHMSNIEKIMVLRAK